jgi:hypothetical protein
MTRERSRDGEEVPLTERYPRPAAVELAAAILIVGGLLGFIGTVAGLASLPPGLEALIAVTFALDISSIVVGVLIRMGRLWLVDVNYVAVVGFLDLLAAGSSALGFLRGIGEVAVVLILFVYRPWFQRRAGRVENPDDVESDRP